MYGRYMEMGSIPIPGMHKYSVLLSLIMSNLTWGADGFNPFNSEKIGFLASCKCYIEDSVVFSKD